MKNIFQTLMLTIMLKVWWHTEGLWGDMHEHESVFLTAQTNGNETRWYVLDTNNTRKFHWINPETQVTKTAWVEMSTNSGELKEKK